MASIALIQSYPYDAIAGGDGAFIQSLGQYLAQSGHDIHGLVTDTTRGRTSPIYQSYYRLDKYRSWRVRNAVRVNQTSFVDYQFARIVVKPLEKLGWKRRISELDIDKWVPREALWTSKQLKKLRPDVIILCFEAVHFASRLTSYDGNILALPGPIPGVSSGRHQPINPRGLDQDKIPAVQVCLAAALAHADCVGFNSCDDGTYAIERLNVKRAIVVGMGFPSQEVLPESSEPVILFVGGATIPNRTGLRWFLTQVWPTIRASCPDARFRIVGRVALSNEASGAAAVDRIGPVADLAPEYRRAQVVIAPLVEGTAGVKIKVAEAISYGRPLVTTSIGADGGDPRQLDPAAIIADHPIDFAHGIIALLQDPNLRQEKSMGAAKVFQSCFSYNSSYCGVSEWIDQVVRGTRSCRGQNVREYCK